MFQEHSLMLHVRVIMKTKSLKLKISGRSKTFSTLLCNYNIQIDKYENLLKNHDEINYCDYYNYYQSFDQFLVANQQKNFTCFKGVKTKREVILP